MDPSGNICRMRHWLNVPSYRHVVRIFLVGVLILYLNITCWGLYTPTIVVINPRINNIKYEIVLKCDITLLKKSESYYALHLFFA